MCTGIHEHLRSERKHFIFHVFFTYYFSSLFFLLLWEEKMGEVMGYVRKLSRARKTHDALGIRDEESFRRVPFRVSLSESLLYRV